MEKSKTLYTNEMGPFDLHKKLLFGVFGVLLFLFSTLTVLGQEAEQLIDLSLESIPRNPQAGETVTIKATSFSIDLNETIISWEYAGKTLVSGYGKTSIQVVAPKNGETALAQASITNSGRVVAASLVLRPGSVDLLWEGVASTVPPFYKGRPLIVADGLFRVVAVPAAGAPQQLNYQWSLNGSSLPTGSGINKSSLTLRHDPVVSERKVSLRATAGSFEGNATINPLPVSFPSVIGYQKRDGFINFARGGTETLAIGAEGGTIRLEPLFFSVPEGVTNGLNFDIRFNGEALYGDKQNEFSFARPENSQEARLTVGITTKKYSLQNVQRLFSLLFQ